MSRFMQVYEWSLFGSSLKIDYDKTDAVFKDIYDRLKRSLDLVKISIKS